MRNMIRQSTLPAGNSDATNTKINMLNMMLRRKHPCLTFHKVGVGPFLKTQKWLSKTNMVLEHKPNLAQPASSPLPLSR